MTDDPYSPSAGQPGHYRPAEVSQQLGISAATLRRWSGRFSDFLVLNESGADGSHRRYTAADVAVLRRVQELLEQGFTYEQVAEQLEQMRPAAAVDAGDQIIDQDGDLPQEEELWAAAPAPDEVQRLPAETLPPAARFLQDTVSALTDTQQIILNSQSATRDLLGVMIQDNLNLKGENTDLRERMLEMERELGEQRRYLADYRERMETRVRVLEDAVSRLMAGQRSPQTPGMPAQNQPTYPPTYNAPPQEKRGFFARLIGG